MGNNTLPPINHVNVGRGRSCKRALAPENSEETIRCIRKKAASEKTSGQAMEVGLCASFICKPESRRDQ